MSHTSEREIELVSHMAREIRVSVIRMLAEAGSGHLGESLAVADIMATLYFHILRHDPSNPDWEERDRLVLFYGHIAPAQYAGMALSGYFPVEKLMTFRRFGSPLQGYPERIRLPGIETTSGPCGDGISQAMGIALGGKMNMARYRVFILTSDSEHQSGILWESVLFAATHRLSNIIHIVIRNGLQTGGATEVVMPLESLAQKYEACGWRVYDVDGHNSDMCIEAVQKATQEQERPVVIIAHTVAGKGVSEIEGDCAWHETVPSKEQAERWVAGLMSKGVSGCDSNSSIETSNVRSVKVSK
jgi:transketolase